MDNKWRNFLSNELPEFRDDSGRVDHRMSWTVLPVEGDWSQLRLTLHDSRGVASRLVATKLFQVSSLDTETVAQRIVRAAREIANWVKITDELADIYA